MSCKFPVAAQASLILLTVAAHAQAAQDLDELPQSVQVVGPATIAELGAQSIGDLLRVVPSANAGYSRVGPYQSSSLKLRGFHADQMRNGIRQRYYEDVDASAL